MNRYGYRLVRDGAVIPARDMRELASLLVRARRDGCQQVEARARATVTRDRPLTAFEFRRLVREATDLTLGRTA